MGQLNLYKIEPNKQDSFLRELEKKKYELIGEPQTIIKNIHGVSNTFEVSFFLCIQTKDNIVEWDWIVHYFMEYKVTSRSNPKGVLLIKTDGNYYACTYGFSYFAVDKYCDSDFAFNFARRMQYKEIKTTTLLSPTSKRNKMVNTYLDYDELEFDSGEAFAKLKAKLDLPEEFTLFEHNIEVGHSIKLYIQNDTIDSILCVLAYVRDTLEKREEIYKIPVFYKVKDKAVVEELNRRLETAINETSFEVNMSELDIIGVTEIFNRNFTGFTLKYKRKTCDCSQITSEIINSFIKEIGLSPYESLTEVKIICCIDGSPVRTDRLFDIIDHTDDEKKCVLSKGKWFYFNEDYLGYLSGSLSEIDVYYDPQFDFSSAIHEQFILSRYNIEKDHAKYRGLSYDAIIEKLKDKYYRERAYNLYLSEQFNFECHDRSDILYGNSKIELMDLYKNQTLYAVKIGSASSTLCYAVDQSLTALKMYKNSGLLNLPVAKSFCIWLILDGRDHLTIRQGKPDINELKMLSLKNRLDHWKKEVRLAGFTPLIWINYYKK